MTASLFHPESEISCFPENIYSVFYSAIDLKRPEFVKRQRLIGTCCVHSPQMHIIFRELRKLLSATNTINYFSEHSNCDDFYLRRCPQVYKLTVSFHLVVLLMNDSQNCQYCTIFKEQLLHNALKNGRTTTQQ